MLSIFEKLMMADQSIELTRQLTNVLTNVLDDLEVVTTS